MMARLTLALALVALLAGGCAARWRPAKRLRIPAAAGSPAQSYTRMIARARALHYHVRDQDPARRRFVVRAQLDEDFATAPEWSRSRASLFHVQVEPDGSAWIWATGHHVREDRMHRKLRREMERLATELQE